MIGNIIIYIHSEVFETSIHIATWVKMSKTTNIQVISGLFFHEIHAQIPAAKTYAGYIHRKVPSLPASGLESASILG